MAWFCLFTADNERVSAHKAALMHIGRNCFRQLKVPDLIGIVTLWQEESVPCEEAACPLRAGRASQVCTAPAAAPLASRCRSVDLAHILAR